MRHSHSTLFTVVLSAWLAGLAQSAPPTQEAQYSPCLDLSTPNVNLGPGGLQHFSLIAGPSLWRNSGTLFWGGGPLPSRSRDIVLPIDPTIEVVQVTVTVRPASSIRLTTPSGREVQSGPGITVVNLAPGRIYRVENPERGNWHLRIEGAESFWVGAEAKTTLTFYRAEFVIYTGRPGHEGLFRIQGQPLLGEPQTLAATLFGAFSTATFQLVSQAGETLAPLDLKQGDPRGDAQDFVGAVTLPPKPFRVQVNGTTPDGMVFQRVFGFPFTPQLVAVSFANVEISFRPGDTVSLPVGIRNIGPAATFRVGGVLTGSDGSFSEATPHEVILDRGERGIAEISVRIPPEVKPGTEITVIVTASDVANSCVSNSAALTVEAE